MSNATIEIHKTACDQFVSCFVYKLWCNQKIYKMDCILEVDIAISSEDKVNYTHALNFLRDNISVLVPYAELQTKTNEQSLQGVKRDWNFNGLNP